MTEDVEQQSCMRRLEFVGSASEYFKIWIVNIVLTILTLGIYSPWAKVRNKKYFNQSTKFAEHRFDYHARPLPILYGRLIALALFLFQSTIAFFHPITGAIIFYLFFLLVPFMVTKSLKFNISNISFRNVRFKLNVQMKEVYKMFIKYFGFPIILSLTGAVTLAMNPHLFNKANTYKGELDSLITAGLGFGYLILIGYFVFISSKVLNSIFELIYNNLHYGNVRIKMNTSLSEVRKNITGPYFKFLGIGILVIILSSIALVFLGKLVPFALILIPFLVISVYVFIVYISLKLPHSIIVFVWNNLSAKSTRSECDLALNAFLKTAVVNMFATAFSFGLLHPWAKIRMTKLKTEAKLLSVMDLNDVIDSASNEEGAIGEEVVDTFDFDFEFGL